MLLFSALLCVVLGDNNDNSIDSYEEEFQRFVENVTETNSFSAHIKDALFVNLHKDNSGGTIFYNDTNGKIFVEFSTFSQCYCTGDDSSGGAICALNCDCVIYCICSDKCYSKKYQGQFIYNYLNTSDRLNFILSSSVSLTPPGDNKYTICLVNGQHYATSINVSRNQVTSCSGIWFNYGPEIEYITYCSFNSNIAQILCIGLQNLNSNFNAYKMNNCNIINNTANGVIMVARPTTISCCCILGNSDLHLFTIYNNAQITITNCTLPDDFEIVSAVNIEEKTSKSFINNLKFTAKEGYCYVGIESYESLTPIAEKAIMTHKQKHSSILGRIIRNGIYVETEEDNNNNTKIIRKMNFVLNESIPTLNVSVKKCNDEANNSQNSNDVLTSSSLYKFILKFFSFAVLNFVLTKPTTIKN